MVQLKGSLNVRLRPGEALCAIALTKRFSGPAFFAEHLGIPPESLRFPDTWTVAAVWLSRANICPDEVRCKYGEWNGQWLHWSQPDQDLEAGGNCPPEVWRQIQSS